MNKRLANIVKEDILKKMAKESWESIRREMAEDVAKNYKSITGVDINDLFTKADVVLDTNKTITTIENVNAKLFDKQLPKIYKWVKQKYKLDKDDYENMIKDSDFIDMITQELEHLVDINKLKYDKEK